MDSTTAGALLITGVVIVSIVLAIALFYYFSILIHELGHLFAARLVGWKPMALCIGHGKRRTLFSVGSVEFQIGSRLLGGTAHAFPKEMRRFRFAHFVFILGGPLVTACFAYVLYLAADRQGYFAHSRFSGDWLWFFCVLECAILAENLWPQMANFSGERLPSDGLSLWRTLWIKETDIPKHFLGCALNHTNLLLRRGHLMEARTEFQNGVAVSGIIPENDLGAEMFWINLLLGADRTDEARAEVLRLANEHPAGSPSRVKALDQLACIPLFYGAKTLIPDALALIDQALAEGPDMVTLKGTKGSLLIESGEIEDGMRLIKEVIEESDSETDQAICAWYLAFGTQKQGNVKEAQERMSAAKTSYPDCIVASRIEKEILAAPVKPAEVGVF